MHDTYKVKKNIIWFGIAKRVTQFEDYGIGMGQLTSLYICMIRITPEGDSSMRVSYFSPPDYQISSCNSKYLKHTVRLLVHT